MTPHFRAVALLISLPFMAAMLWSPNALAQQASAERAVIEIVQIQYRDPGQVRTALRSAIDPRGSIGQIDDKLVIATTAANLGQLQEIIADIDVPPRRLVIGVDFDYRAGTAANSTQQQSQAIEGESLVFVDNSVQPTASLPDADSTVEETPDSNAPRISIAAEIIGDGASVNATLSNFAGLSGSHIARVPLGSWQRMTPPPADTDSVPGVETDTTADAAQTNAPIVAVRIDVVP